MHNKNKMKYLGCRKKIDLERKMATNCCLQPYFSAHVLCKCFTLFGLKRRVYWKFGGYAMTLQKKMNMLNKGRSGFSFIQWLEWNYATEHKDKQTQTQTHNSQSAACSVFLTASGPRLRFHLHQSSLSLFLSFSLSSLYHCLFPFFPSSLPPFCSRAPHSLLPRQQCEEEGGGGSAGALGGGGGQKMSFQSCWWETERIKMWHPVCLGSHVANTDSWFETKKENQNGSIQISCDWDIAENQNTNITCCMPTNMCFLEYSLYLI